MSRYLPWDESTGMSEEEYNKMVASDLGNGPRYTPNTNSTPPYTPKKGSIADQLNWELNWDKPSGYTPANEYIRPWDREGWGANDIVRTPPRNPGGYVPPSKPGIQEGQKDYVFMPTEKEQWRTEDENKRRQALAVGKDWREARLPRKDDKLPGDVMYNPTDKEKSREREWGESRPGEGYIQVEGPGNPSWERRNPREREVTIQPVPRRENRRPSLRDQLMGNMRSNRGLSNDEDRMSILRSNRGLSNNEDRMSMLTGRW